MKVETVPAPFIPVSIQITFESQEELDMFVQVVGYNETIPALVTKHVTKDRQEKYNLCTEMLTALHRKSVFLSNT